MKIDLAYRPRRWQEHCHRNMRRFSVLVMHRRAGKTELAMRHLLDRAVRFRAELGLFVYIAPLLKQAKEVVWARLKQMIEPLRISGACEIMEGELRVRFLHNGASIRLFGADNPDALRGVRLDGVVVDEVAQIKPELWNDILQPALSDRKGWAVFIGTPNGVNLFSELYHKARSGTLPDWWGALYTVYDTDAIDPEEVRSRQRDMPANSFAREYLCDFSAGAEDQLISLAEVTASAQAGERVYSDYATAAKILGVDPARSSHGDRAVIIRRQGLQAFRPQVHAGIDNMALASMVAQEIHLWRPDAVFIDAGAGSGVIDRLRQLGHDVIEVPFGSSALKPLVYKNRRTEMWSLMADWIRAGGRIPNLPDLIREIATPTVSYDEAGRRVLEAKDSIRARLMADQSPDIADALALTFAIPVMPRQMAQETGMRRPDVVDYDPFASARSEGPRRTGSVDDGRLDPYLWDANAVRNDRSPLW